MNRLTEKDKDHIGGYAPNGTYNTAWKANAFDKLGKYEDIEEEFGIDLIKILTAKEVYTFGTGVIAPHKLGRTNKIIKCNTFYFDFVNKTKGNLYDRKRIQRIYL